MFALYNASEEAAATREIQVSAKAEYISLEADPGNPHASKY